MAILVRMELGMHTIFKAFVGLLALVGLFNVAIWIWIWGWKSEFCESQILARAVSPGGILAAEHYRRHCADDRPDEYYLQIGTPWRETSATYVQSKLRSDVVRSNGKTLSMKPLRMWWLSESALHIETDPLDSLELPHELHGVKIETRAY